MCSRVSDGFFSPNIDLLQKDFGNCSLGNVGEWPELTQAAGVGVFTTEKVLPGRRGTDPVTPGNKGRAVMDHYNTPGDISIRYSTRKESIIKTTLSLNHRSRSNQPQAAPRSRPIRQVDERLRSGLAIILWRTRYAPHWTARFNR